jgi:hypothetical protein
MIAVERTLGRCGVIPAAALVEAAVRVVHELAGRTRASMRAFKRGDF